MANNVKTLVSRGGVEDGQNHAQVSNTFSTVRFMDSRKHCNISGNLLQM